MEKNSKISEALKNVSKSVNELTDIMIEGYEKLKALHGEDVAKGWLDICLRYNK